MCRIASLRSSTNPPTGSTAVSALLVSLSWPLNVEQRSQDAQVPAHERSGAALQALGDLGQLDPHLLAREQPRLGRLGERHPRAHEQRLDARDGRLHRLGDLLVGQGVHLAEHERGPLGLGKRRGCRRRAAGTPRARGPCRRWWRRARTGGCPSSRRPTAWIRRRWLRLRLRAIRYSHGRTLIGRSSSRIALNAAENTSCRTSSASSREPSRCRQKASRRAW